MDTVVFDLGKVLLDWNPRYFYRQFFAEPRALERFLAEALPMEWVAEMDAGEGRLVDERRKLHESQIETVGRQLRALTEREVEEAHGVG